MTYILTQQNIIELLTPVSPSEKMDLASDIELSWPVKIAQGCSRSVMLRDGLRIQFESLTPQSDLHLKATYKESDPFSFIFVLSGNVHSVLTKAHKNIEFSPSIGTSLLGYGGTDKGTVCYLANQTVQLIQIVVEPWLLHQFVEKNLVNLPLGLRQILQGDHAQSYVHSAATTPIMQMALHQLWHCPHQGMTRRLYLESKAIELLALKLDQLNTTPKRPLPKALKPKDIERIHYAKEILLRDIENPPSLLSLAKAAGLNDYKLKQGFRYVFDSTVFGYLNNYRMEQARKLLKTSNLTVSEVAYSVGFSNRSHFAATFKRKFGTNPKSFLIHSQRERLSKTI